MVMMFSMNVVAVLGWVRGLRFSRRRISDATVRMDDDDGDDESSKVAKSSVTEAYVDYNVTG